MSNEWSGRDRALDFHWKAFENLYSSAGVPDVADKKYDEARRAIIAAVCIAYDVDPASGGWVSYSRRRAFYTKRLLNAVVRHNGEIAKDIGADRGIRLMAVDSAMAIEVLKACEKASVPCLPVHDSFIVPASHRSWMEARMDEILAGVLGAVSRSPASVIG